jgi:hypothetical protein
VTSRSSGMPGLCMGIKSRPSIDGSNTCPAHPEAA